MIDFLPALVEAQLKEALNLSVTDNVTAADVQAFADFRDDSCVDPYNILQPVGNIEVCMHWID